MGWEGGGVRYVWGLRAVRNKCLRVGAAREAAYFTEGRVRGKALR